MATGRILEDQAGSAARSTDHATTNSLHAVAWDFLAKNGPEARWTPDDHERLVELGWSPDKAISVAQFLFDNQDGCHLSRRQIDTYLQAFGIADTHDNVTRIKRIVFEARAAACREATKRLPVDNSEEVGRWVEEAMVDDTPFAFEQIRPQHATKVSESMVEGAPTSIQTPTAPPVPKPSREATPVATKKLLLAACEKCVAAHEQAGAWSAGSIKQTRTALMLFDYACGGQASIEDLVQDHVTSFVSLCRKLPNRWGRTTEEQAGGIDASLKRAESMPAGDIEISQQTINKHLTWISAVLKHAAGEEGATDGHRPAKPLLARAGLGKKAARERKRDRDKRANWTRQEVAQLLSAPLDSNTLLR